MSEKEKSRSSLSRTSLYKMNRSASLRLEQVLKQNRLMSGERPSSRLDRLRVSRVSVASSKYSVASSKYSVASGSRRKRPRSSHHRARKSKRRESSVENDTVSPVDSQRRVSTVASGRVARKKQHPSRSKRKRKKRETENNIEKKSSGSRMDAYILAGEQMTPSYVSGSSEMTIVGEGRPIEILASQIFPQASAPPPSGQPLTENQNKSYKVTNYFKKAINASIFEEPVAANVMRKSGTDASNRIGLGQKKVDGTDSLIRNKNFKQTVTTAPVEVSKVGKDTWKATVKHETVEKSESQKESQPKITSQNQKGHKPSVSEVIAPPKKRVKSPNSKISEEGSETLKTSSLILPKSSKPSTQSTSHIRLANKVKEGKETKLRSALKSSPSQLEAASRDMVESRSSIIMPEADKKSRRVSILAGTDSLEELSGVITRPEREKTLEAIRRLEEVAKVKRQELAETRRKMRVSLEEEIEINKKLEKIVGKMKIIRLAGEEAAKILEQDKQASSTKNVKAPVKNKK